MHCAWSAQLSGRHWGARVGPGSLGARTRSSPNSARRRSRPERSRPPHSRPTKPPALPQAAKLRSRLIHATDCDRRHWRGGRLYVGLQPWGVPAGSKRTPAPRHKTAPNEQPSADARGTRLVVRSFKLAPVDSETRVILPQQERPHERPADRHRQQAPRPRSYGRSRFVNDLRTGQFLRLSNAVSKWGMGGPTPNGLLLWDTPINDRHGATQRLGPTPLLMHHDDPVAAIAKCRPRCCPQESQSTTLIAAQRHQRGPRHVSAFNSCEGRGRTYRS